MRMKQQSEGDSSCKETVWKDYQIAIVAVAFVLLAIVLGISIWQSVVIHRLRKKETRGRMRPRSGAGQGAVLSNF